MSGRGTIVYVHGASDRSASVDDHVLRIERQLAGAGMAFDVLASRWGETAGANLGRIEAALPLEPAVASRLVAGRHPMAALADLRSGVTALGVAAAADEHRQADELLDICRTQVGQPGESIELRDDGQAIPLATACRVAAESVAESTEYRRAHESTAPEPQLIDAVGQAVIATVASRAAAPLEVARTLEVRIAEAVLGAAGATIFAGYLGIDVGPDLKRWATDILVPHRARLVREAGLGPADIVLYMRQPDAIRQVVRASLSEALARGGPVVALGNSLGGIILVDVLSAADAPRPDLLVTVGSQAPLLATFGALAPLGLLGAPPPFQPWLNIFDRRDLLGFVAGRVWPDESAITDHQVDLGVGFPDSHGARYLSHPEVYWSIGAHPALNGADGGAWSGRRFPIDSRSITAVLRFILAVDADNAFIEVADELIVRFGRFNLRTPLANAAHWQAEPVSRGATLVGFIGGLGGGVAALGAAATGLRLALRRPARWMIFNVGALELSVLDPQALAAALARAAAREQESGLDGRT